MLQAVLDERVYRRQLDRRQSLCRGRQRLWAEEYMRVERSDNPPAEAARLAEFGVAFDDVLPIGVFMTDLFDA